METVIAPFSRQQLAPRQAECVKLNQYLMQNSFILVANQNIIHIMNGNFSQRDLSAAATNSWHIAGLLAIPCGKTFQWYLLYGAW
jgi:hypothetical protein